jgi:DNA-binding response OmpR family regulator
MAVAEVEVSPDPGEIPIVVCIALGKSDRERVAQLINGLGMVVMAPDLRTAHAILGRQVGFGAVPSDHRAINERIVRLGELEIDEGHCRVVWRGAPIALTRRERDLLARLAAEPARGWTFAQLHAAAWGDHFIGEPAAVHAAIKRLRRKLRESGVSVRLDSVRGVGYQLTLEPPAA